MFKMIGSLTKLALVLIVGFVYLAWLASDTESDPNGDGGEASLEAVPTRSGRIRQDCNVYPSPSEDAKPIGWLSNRTAVIVEDDGGEWLELLAPGGTRYLDRMDYLPWSEIKKHDKLYIKKSTFTTEIVTGRPGRRPSNQLQMPLTRPAQDGVAKTRKTTKEQPRPPAS